MGIARESALPSVEAGKTIEDTRERLRSRNATPPAAGDKTQGDKAQQFLWGVLSGMCLYAARRVPEISDSIVDVDRAMRWGFGWELGPFETWDAIGVAPMQRLGGEHRQWSRICLI
jgi:3-hydroxyacyl-CoA dehydrogenase